MKKEYETDSSNFLFSLRHLCTVCLIMNSLQIAAVVGEVNGLIHVISLFFCNFFKNVIFVLIIIFYIPENQLYHIGKFYLVTFEVY